LADFHDGLLKGENAKNLIKVLLQKSGYNVYPYGYENTLSDVRDKLFAKETKNSPTVRRIRSSPDLLVYDSERHDLMLVEVKFRDSKTPWLRNWRIMNYQEYWKDSILAIIVPFNHVFYAQRICDLECKERFNPDIDFLKIEEIFQRIKPEDIEHFKADALKLGEGTAKSN
jgi:hypothetical protein